MCLAVPGLVEAVTPASPDGPGLPTARVRFGGATREVCLALLPDVSPGDWVVVHVGFALSRLDEEAARRLLDELETLEEPAPG